MESAISPATSALLVKRRRRPGLTELPAPPFNSSCRSGRGV